MEREMEARYDEQLSSQKAEEDFKCFFEGEENLEIHNRYFEIMDQIGNAEKSLEQVQGKPWRKHFICCFQDKKCSEECKMKTCQEWLSNWNACEQQCLIWLKLSASSRRNRSNASDNPSNKVLAVSLSEMRKELERALAKGYSSIPCHPSYFTSEDVVVISHRWKNTIENEKLKVEAAAEIILKAASHFKAVWIDCFCLDQSNADKIQEQVKESHKLYRSHIVFSIGIGDVPALDYMYEKLLNLTIKNEKIYQVIRFVDNLAKQQNYHNFYAFSASDPSYVYQLFETAIDMLPECIEATLDSLYDIRKKLTQFQNELIDTWIDNERAWISVENVSATYSFNPDLRYLSGCVKLSNAIEIILYMAMYYSIKKQEKCELPSIILADMISRFHGFIIHTLGPAISKNDLSLRTISMLPVSFAKDRPAIAYWLSERFSEEFPSFPDYCGNCSSMVHCSTCREVFSLTIINDKKNLWYVIPIQLFGVGGSFSRKLSLFPSPTSFKDLLPLKEVVCSNWIGIKCAFNGHCKGFRSCDIIQKFGWKRSHSYTIRGIVKYGGAPTFGPEKEAWAPLMKILWSIKVTSDWRTPFQIAWCGSVVTIFRKYPTHSVIISRWIVVGEKTEQYLNEWQEIQWSPEDTKNSCIEQEIYVNNE